MQSTYIQYSKWITLPFSIADAQEQIPEDKDMQLRLGNNMDLPESPHNPGV